MFISLALSQKKYGTCHVIFSWALCAMLLLAIPITMCRAAEAVSTEKAEGVPIRIKGYLFKWLPRPPIESEAGDIIIDEAKQHPSLVKGQFYLERRDIYGQGETYLLTGDITKKLRDKSPRHLTYEEERAAGLFRTFRSNEIFSNKIAIIEGRATIRGRVVTEEVVIEEHATEVGVLEEGVLEEVVIEEGWTEVVVTDVVFEGSKKDLEKLAEKMERMVNPKDALALKAASQENLEIGKFLFDEFSLEDLEFRGIYERDKDIELELVGLQGAADSLRKIAVGKVQWQDVVEFMEKYRGEYQHLEKVITAFVYLQERKPKAQVEWERLVKKNPQEAIDLVKALKDQDEDSRQLALDAVVTSLSWSNPDKAVELLITSGEDKWWESEVLQRILKNWAKKDVKQVVAWIETIKDHDNMAYVTENLFRHRDGSFPSSKGPSRDHDEALSLASSLKSLEQRTIALATILQASIQNGSHIVNSLLLGIKDINEQVELVFRILDGYNYQDNGEKDKWFKALPLELREPVDLKMKEAEKQRRDKRRKAVMKEEPKPQPDPNPDF